MRWYVSRVRGSASSAAFFVVSLSSSEASDVDSLRGSSDKARRGFFTAVAAREIHHHRAALAEGALRELIGLDHRREACRVLRQVLLLLRLPPDVLLVDRNPGGAHEDADGHVVHARREHVQLHCHDGPSLSLVAQPESSPTRRTPATMDWSFRKARSRGRYFIPQSGATTSRSRGSTPSAFRIRSATTSGDSTSLEPRSRTPSTIVFPETSRNTFGSRFGWAASSERCVAEHSPSSRRNG